MVKDKTSRTPNKKEKVRGDVLKTDFTYILEKEGKDGLKKINQELKKIDKNLDYYKIKNTVWVPIDWKIALMKKAEELFKWQEEDFFNLGYSASRNSFITRTLLKYFVSLEKTFQECPKYWKKYWDVGKITPHRLDLEKKYLVIRLEEFKLHPNLCNYMRGHFKAFAELVLRKEVEIEELKCNFKGDEFHEFKIYWN